MAQTPWRVALITMVPFIARGYDTLLRQLGHEPAVVITPRRARPGAPPNPFAAEHVADDPHELDVVFAASRSAIERTLRSYEIDLGLCTGFPWKIPAAALAVPQHGIVNGHPSLLPRHRGPFPLAWAVRNGDREVGLSYHLMDAAFDTGNLLAQMPVELADDDTFESLNAKFEPAAGQLLPVALGRLAAGDRGDPQGDGGEYESVFEDDYRYVDPAQPAEAVHRQARAWSFVPPIPNRGPILERGGEKVRLARTSLDEVEGADRLDCADAPVWILETEPV